MFYLLLFSKFLYKTFDYLPKPIVEEKLEKAKKAEGEYIGH